MIPSCISSRVWATVVVALLSVSSSSACAGGADEPEAGAVPDHVAVEEWRLGRADGGGPDVFAMPAALEVDAHGRLYVLDAQAGEVRVFDADGGWVRTLGRSGAGPGELAQPMGMALSPEGRLWVVDPGNARFMVWDTAGTLVGAEPRASGLTAYPWPGRFDARGGLWDVASGSGGLDAPPTLVRLDPASRAPERVALPPFRPARFTAGRGGVMVTARVPFAPELAWALDGEGRAWSGTTDRYRLVLRDPSGDTLRVVERAVTRMSVAPAERDSAARALDWFTAQGGRVDVSRIPREKPAFVSLRTDDRNRLWVRATPAPGAAGAVFDRFGPDGRPEARVVLPMAHDDAMPLVFRGDHAYAVVVADTGVPQVVRLRISG